MANFKDHLRQLEARAFYLQNKPKGFSDADGAIFFARQLEYIESQVYNVLYQDLKYRAIFPVDSSIPVGVKSIGYWTYDKAGKAKWINTGAKDLPRVDIGGKETLLPVHWAGASFGYNIGEIASAQFAGVPLDQMKADATRRAHEELLNETCWFGNADNGLVGLFSAGTGIPSAAAPNAPWSTATPDEVVSDVNKIFSDVVVDTLEKEKPTHLMLPTAEYNRLGSTRMTETGITLWQYLIANSPWIAGPDNIVSVPELTDIGGATTAAVAYTRDPAKIEQKIPQDIVFHPVQQVGLEWIVNV
ncbi:MAG: DUF2184 domain-containing protein, partial [Candidatus Diapherotrites archaeon]|nr:DUF2184 domain-containing protein [Candidatus Diapherotrites archaeon]